LGDVGFAFGGVESYLPADFHYTIAWRNGEDDAEMSLRFEENGLSSLGFRRRSQSGLPGKYGC
jgi:hypothetical protein